MFHTKPFLVCVKEHSMFQSLKEPELRNRLTFDFGETTEHFSVRTVNGKKVLCYRDKEFLKLCEFDKVVESEFLYCKGVGSRKVKQRLLNRYEGVSEPRVQRILSKSNINQMVNAKFGNKAISRPVRTKGVQVINDLFLY